MARDRSFTISLEDYESEPHFRDAVRQAVLDTEAIGHREGGAFVNTPIRVERESSFVDSGGGPIRNFVTIGWMFSHTFMPAARMAVPEAEADLDAAADHSSFLNDLEDQEEIDAREAEEEFVGVGNVAEQVAEMRDEPVEAE